MTATIKSRVLVREEKGLGNLSMKRLVFCGMGAGMSYFVVNLTPLRVCSIPTLFVTFVLFVFLSGQRYGVVRHRWLWLNWQGRLLLNATRSPSGMAAQVCDVLNLETRAAAIDGLDLFPGGSSALTDSDLKGIEILDSDHLEAGGFEVLADDELKLEDV